MPYVTKPDAIVPGIANYYASTFVHGGDVASILVKTREGRPIKIEANDLAPSNYGKTSARAQASVLSLYDTNRFATPLKKSGNGFQATSWADLDKEVKRPNLLLLPVSGFLPIPLPAPLRSVQWQILWLNILLQKQWPSMQFHTALCWMPTWQILEKEQYLPINLTKQM